MSKLFRVLDALIDGDGDMEKYRTVIESHLNDLDYINAVAGAADVSITAVEAARIRDAGLAWVRDVNEGNGEWGRMRGEAEQALA